MASAVDALEEVDPFDLIPPFDIMGKLNAGEFKTLIQSKKWNERMEALKELTELVDAHPRLLIKDRVEFRELIMRLEATLQRDSNVNVCASAATALNRLATGLRNEYQPFAVTTVAACIEKFKEKKGTFRAPLLECIDSVALTISALTSNRVQTLLAGYLGKVLEGLGKPSPLVREQTLLFLYRLYNKHSKRTVPSMMLSDLAPTINKLTSDPDPDVRKAACSVIAAALRCVGLETGKKLFFAEVFTDEAKKAKITEECEKLIAEHGDKVVPAILYLFDPRAKARSEKVAAGPGGASTNGGASMEGDSEEQPEEADPFDLIPPFDIMGKLNAGEFETLIQSKKWNERMEALKELIELVDAHPRLLIKDRVEFRELIVRLEAILQRDSNVNVCASAATALKGLASGLRKEYHAFAVTTVAACIEKFKEKKATLRSPLLECIDSVALTTPLAGYLGKVLEGLGKPSPPVREQTLLFLYRLYNKHNRRTASSMMLNDLAPIINKLTSDPDPDVRKAACSVVAAALRCIGVDTGKKLFFAEVFTEEAKKAKITEECDKLIAEHGDKVVPAILHLMDPRAKANTEKRAGGPNGVTNGGAKEGGGPQKSQKASPKAPLPSMSKPNVVSNPKPNPISKSLLPPVEKIARGKPSATELKPRAAVQRSEIANDDASGEVSSEKSLRISTRPPPPASKTPPSKLKASEFKQKILPPLAPGSCIPRLPRD